VVDGVKCFRNSTKEETNVQTVYLFGVRDTTKACELIRKTHTEE